MSPYNWNKLNHVSQFFLPVHRTRAVLTVPLVVYKWKNGLSGMSILFWDFICVRLALKTPRLPFLFPGCFLNVSTSKIAHGGTHRVKQPGSWGCLGRLPTPTPKGCIRDMLSVQLWLLFVCTAKCFCKIHVNLYCLYCCLMLWC